MFVRSRTVGRRYRRALIEPRRVEGKVRPEHVASRGSIPVEMSIDDRVAFWASLHQRLGRLSNRLDATAQAKLLGEGHARIPMVTVEEIRAHQLANAEADERFWSGLADMQTDQAEGNRQLAAQAERKAAEAKRAAENATAGAESAKERIERLKRGEAVSGGLGKPVNVQRIMREAGMTTADFRRMLRTHMIAELGGEAGFQELLDEIHKRHRAAEKAARRDVLRRQVRQALAEGRMTLR